MGNSIIYNLTPQELQELLDSSNGYSDVLRKLDLNPKGGNPKTLKRIISEYDLDVTKLNENRKKLYQKLGTQSAGREFPLEEIFNGMHPGYSASKLLKRIVEAGLKQYKCEICGISSWNGKPIALQLHHKDGEHDNNSFNNLQILCPNCHSQTDNYAGKRESKNKEIRMRHPRVKKVPPISRDDLKHKIRTDSFSNIAREYNVTDNAIRKWCDKYGLPRKVSVIKRISDIEWELI